MRFCDLAHIFHKYRTDKKEDAAMCVLKLTDAILEDTALESLGHNGKEVNPLYDKSTPTLQGIYNGKRLKISQEDAAILLQRSDEQHFAEYVETSYSFDARQQMAADVSKYGFDAHPDDVAEICANIMFQIINLRAEGKDDDVTTLDFKRKETGKRIKDIAPATIERRGDKLHICGEEIIIRKEIFPDDIKKGLKCFQALCDVYAEALKITDRVITEDDLPSLPGWCQEDFADQQECYFSAEGIQHSIRDIFDDGEDEFELLKKDAWQGINMTYRKRYDSGYDRLIAVLEKITNTRLDLSTLVQIRNLIGNMERKGICHILVNDGTIESWVRKMQKLFNSTFEVSLRLMLLLSVTGDVPMTVDRIAAYDVMTIYSRDFGLSEEVLHGDNEFGLSEFASRRNKTQIALRELVLNGSVKALTSDKGFFYQITPAGKGVAENMVTQYATDYKRLAKITAARYHSMKDEDIMVVINTTSEESLRR